MKLFDDRFHQQLHQEVPQSNVKLFEEQVSYSLPQAQAAALLFQEEVLKKLRQQRDEGEDQHASEDVVENVLLAEAMSHNSAAERSDREWIPLEDSLLGPAHVAKLLIRQVQENGRHQKGSIGSMRNNWSVLPCSCRHSTKGFRAEQTQVSLG